MIPLFRPSRIIRGDEELTFTREGTAVNENIVYVDGKPVKRAPITFKVVCNVQPVDGRDLERVPEGDRYKENLTLFCDNFESEKKPKANDKVCREGKVYQVATSADWGSYTEARIVLIDVGPDIRPFDTNP